MDGTTEARDTICDMAARWNVLWQLVRESKDEPNIVMDRNATALEQRRSVAPLTNSSYGRCYKWFRPAYRLDALDVPVSANHGV
jgi:hypothetical protein